MTAVPAPSPAEREDDGADAADAGDRAAGGSQGKSSTMHDADVANGENPAE